MKNKSILLLLTAAFLAGCSTSGNSSTGSSTGSSTSGSSTSQTTTSTSGGTSTTSTTESGSSTSSSSQSSNGVAVADSIQDMTILHAWNWSMGNINSRLDDIKNAGYGAIQLSPMQVQKDYYSGSTWPGQWWKLYQPVSFSVASNSNENVLGTKSQLATLCSNAEKKGLKIVMDVVSNHLGSQNSWQNFNSQVKDYEPTIYNNNLKHNVDSYTDIIVYKKLSKDT